MFALAKYLLVVGAVLAVTVMVFALPGVSAKSAAAPIEKSKNSCLAGYWYDNADNEYEIYGGSTSSCGKPYKISGELYYSDYLYYTPWTVKGTGAYDGFTLVATAPAAAVPYGDCSFQESGIVSGSVGSLSATGVWYNLGCGGGGGTFTFTQTASGPMEKFSGGRPGVASAAVTGRSSSSCMSGYWYDNQGGGNDYEIYGSSKACGKPYKISGELYYSPYLYGTPWAVKGSGAYEGFTWVNTASATGAAYGDCSWEVSALLSGSPPSQTGAGIWWNLGCGGGYGTFDLTQTASGPMATYSGTPGGGA